MTCSKCGKENRPEAKYCRFCGGALEQAPSRNDLIAKSSIEDELGNLDKKIKVAKTLASTGTRIGLDCLILGDSGCGKTFLAGLIADKMTAAGIVKQAPKVVDASDWDEFSADFDKNISALKNGILTITNAQKLLPAANAQDVNRLDKLFNRMRATEGAPIVLLCGLLNDKTEILSDNKTEHRLFEFDFRLEAFGIQDLTDLTLHLLHEKYHMKTSDDLPRRLGAHFAWYVRQPELGFANGHLAEKVAEDLYVEAVNRGGKVVEEKDIDIAECFIPKSEEQILAELDEYIGLQSVKNEIKAVVRNVKKKKEKGVKDRLLKDHFIFTGNPGTGKTTIARKFGEVLNAVGALPTGQFVEISGKDGGIDRKLVFAEGYHRSPDSKVANTPTVFLVDADLLKSKGDLLIKVSPRNGFGVAGESLGCRLPAIDEKPKNEV